MLARRPSRLLVFTRRDAVRLTVATVTRGLTPATHAAVATGIIAFFMTCPTMITCSRRPLLRAVRT